MNNDQMNKLRLQVQLLFNGLKPGGMVEDLKARAEGDTISVSYAREGQRVWPLSRKQFDRCTYQYRRMIREEAESRKLEFA